MLGRKERKIRRLQALADARLFKIQVQRTHHEITASQRSKAWRTYGSAMDIIATHITTRGSHDQLQAALERAGHGPELRYALLDHPVNEQPEVTA